MQVYYLHNSSVAAVFNKSLLVFDHYMNENEGLGKGSVSQSDLTDSDRVYVFVSHSHGDHFSPGIFSWADFNPNTTYILDSTVPDEHNEGQSVVLNRSGIFKDDYIYVREFGSTDIGGSFFVRCEGVNIYHAGDFNLWHWREEGNDRYTRAMEKYFEKELNYLKDNATGIDVAFFPVDSRMGSGSYEGAEIFIKTMKPKIFIPIHFLKFEDTHDFAKNKFEGTEILDVSGRGQRLV